ncbi:dolichyl-phosphate beta-glucosyltransferase-like [Tropilaelaps mercedesae]|uniref:Dolichyl-phosphate beta-glucosyltransferase n=1 Tax=Tropilaelaps mercedesae TaxID=418985 RepID=A0A1V9XUH4_9ACAR|nr:dolichyl-phosphate beta-glucosyltransferase-like [Tropilaelaps mercedesae]
MDLPSFFWAIIAVALAVLIVLSAILYSTSSRYPDIVRYEEEMYFKCGENLLTKKAFPKLFDEPTVKLSVIIPAFEEQTRLPPMLEECITYLESRCRNDKDFTYEVIVVDDGSRDRTTQVSLEYAARIGTDRFRVLTLVKNRGKGGAVRLGMLCARGELLLFADADGATTFEDCEKLEDVMAASRCKSAYSIVIGSRAHLQEKAVAERTLFRTILMYGFHYLVMLFAVQGIRDTQCGFKLFTREAARVIFASLHVERWAFDVEMLFIAQKLNFIISEVAVRWTEIDGSKVTPFWSWCEMGRDLILIWYRYLIGAWAIRAAVPCKSESSDYIKVASTDQAKGGEIRKVR